MMGHRETCASFLPDIAGEALKACGVGIWYVKESRVYSVQPVVSGTCSRLYLLCIVVFDRHGIGLGITGTDLRFFLGER